MRATMQKSFVKSTPASVSKKSQKVEKGKKEPAPATMPSEVSRQSSKKMSIKSIEKGDMRASGRSSPPNILSPLAVAPKLPEPPKQKNPHDILQAEHVPNTSRLAPI